MKQRNKNKGSLQKLRFILIKLDIYGERGGSLEFRDATWRQAGFRRVTWQGDGGLYVTRGDGNINCNARDCRHCAICNGIVGTMEREVREPLRQPHLAI